MASPDSFFTSPTNQVGTTGLNVLTSSNVIEVYDKATPDVQAQLGMPFGSEDLGIMQLLEEAGQTESAVFGNEYVHFEQGRIRDLVKSSGAGTDNAGASVSFTVSTTSSVPAGSPLQTWYANPTSATTVNNVRIGDVLWVPRSGGNAYETKVTNISGQTVTVVPVKVYDTNLATDCAAIASAIDANTEMFVGGNAWAEGTGQPTSRDVKTYKYTNFIQTFKETYKVNGATLGQMAAIEMPNGAKYWYIQGILNARRNFEQQIEAQLLAGSKIDTTSSVFDETFKTEGLITSMQQYANSESYTVGSFSLTDIDSGISKLKKYRGASENLFVAGNGLITEIDDIIRTSEGMKAGGIQYAGIGGSDRAVRFGFDSFTRSGVTFHYKSLQAFDDPTMFGATNSSYKDLGLVLPTGNTTSYDYGRSAISVPTMRMVYLDVEGEQMGYKEWLDGAAGAVSIGENDVQAVYMRKRAGLEVFGLNRFLLFTAV